MNLSGGVWLADLMQDRPYLPIREQNTAIGGGDLSGISYENNTLEV
jgi:hypothetical protein